jgi:hypothetical protein
LKGRGLIEDMLAYLQVEFKYERILSILESATRVARSEKAIAYEEAKNRQERLREIRLSHPR